MRVGPLCLLLVALSVFATPVQLLAQSAPQDFGAAPSAGTLRAANRQLENAGRVRVVMHRGALVLSGVRVDEQGVHYSGILERDFADTLSAPGVIPWSRVAQIDKRISAAGHGARYGAIFLGVLGGVAGMAIGGIVQGQDSGAIGGGLLGVAIGGATGGALGALFTSPGRLWKRVYPSDSDLNP